MIHTVGPRDLPEARQDLLAWLDGPGDSLLSQTQGPGTSAALAVVARSAGLYYVNADMSALARTVGAGLDVYGLTSADLPEPYGLLVWEAPVTDEPAHRAPIAVLWMSTDKAMKVMLFVAAEDYRNWAFTTGRQAAYSPDLIAAGYLAMRGASQTLPISVPDRDWDSLGLGDHEDILRTLLATWILIRQPVDQRRSLHEVTEVAAPRSAQKRIRRAGGDPTALVRLVTLRQSLRPAKGAVDDTDHAQRLYRHRWWVGAHRMRQYFPSRGEHEVVWRGPYLATPAGCENAPILGSERVNVLRR